MKDPDRVMLLRALLDVRYIIDQALAWLLWDVRKTEFSAWPEEQRAILKNACIESSLLSIRILNEFFRNERTKQLIKAVHYMGSDSPGPFLDGAEAQKINDHLAHLTWARLEDDAPPWSEELTARALERCHVFLAFILEYFLTTSDSEHAPCTQEFEAITEYLRRKRR